MQYNMYLLNVRWWWTLGNILSTIDPSTPPTQPWLPPRLLAPEGTGVTGVTGFTGVTGVTGVTGAQWLGCAVEESRLSCMGRVVIDKKFIKK